MFIDIHEIGREALDFDTALGLRELDGLAEDRIVVRRARLHGSAVRVKGGVDLNASLQATLELECSRCLEPFLAPLSTHFFLKIVPEAVESGSGEARMDLEDANLFYAREGKADLDAMAAEQIYLSLPLKPICREDCRGLCSACGSNLNRGSCGCRTEEVDPRLAPLLQFRRRREDL